MVRLRNPWPDGYTINTRSPYGWRVHPITRKKKFHHGVDVAMPVGTPLMAPADGKVAHKGSGASGGFTLIVEHAPDLFTVYYHLAKPSALPVGAEVFEGDLIAFSGNTGASTGPHLHFETRRSRKWGDTFDPTTILGKPSQRPQEPISAPQPVSEPDTPAEPEKPSTGDSRPQSVVKPPLRPMSAGLKRFFQIRKWLK